MLVHGLLKSGIGFSPYGSLKHTSAGMAFVLWALIGDNTFLSHFENAIIQLDSTSKYCISM